MVVQWLVSDFLPQSKDVRLIGNSKFSIGVNVSVDSCLTLCWHCDELATCKKVYPAFVPRKLG